MTHLTLTIPNWESFKYSELYKVVEYKDGCVYKVANIGYHVRNDFICPDGYQKVVISDKNDSILLKLITDIKEISL